LDDAANDMARLDRLARFLAGLHRIDATKPELAFLSDYESFVAAQLAKPREQSDGDLSQTNIRDRLLAVWPPPMRNRKAVLHGDFWLGNVLWHGDELGAVIDWENVAIGDPLADLANVRLELFWSAGPRSAEDFTRAYQVSADVDIAALPCWDLWAALRPASTFAGWGLGAAAMRDMREKHREFVERALRQLATAPRSA
jgi:aminoglycoside phosphotransferase (APT) family kinase protein